jgi:hypothetical protein
MRYRPPQLRLHPQFVLVAEGNALPLIPGSSYQRAYLGSLTPQWDGRQPTVRDHAPAAKVPRSSWLLSRPAKRGSQVIAELSNFQRPGLFQGSRDGLATATQGRRHVASSPLVRKVASGKVPEVNNNF